MGRAWPTLGFKFPGDKSIDCTVYLLMGMSGLFLKVPLDFGKVAQFLQSLPDPTHRQSHHGVKITLDALYKHHS